eukprot:c7465_g1_i1.p1 GENE.c7465_g1_i1~~c7465_g1_i1.p1  ORF type:complete len:144 (-),score=22.03 c7465_g1_i1:37-468(-)
MTADLESPRNKRFYDRPRFGTTILWLVLLVIAILIIILGIILLILAFSTSKECCDDSHFRDPKFCETFYPKLEDCSKTRARFYLFLIAGIVLLILGIIFAYIFLCGVCGCAFFRPKEVHEMRLRSKAQQNQQHQQQQLDVPQL